MIIENFSVETLFLTIASLSVLWIVVSIPVWFASKALTGVKVSFAEASMATLAGPIVYVSVIFAFDLVIGTISGLVGLVFGYISELLTWIWTFRDDFKTGWIPAIQIAFLALAVFITFSMIIGSVFGITYSWPFFPKIIF